MNSRRVAFIDIGTNAILCLIAELKNDGSFEVLDDLAEIPRLGQGVHRTGRISPERAARSLQVLRRYLERCERHAVEEVVAVGTSALRDARNSAEVRAQFKEQLGFDVRVISGDEEAAYSFLAVQEGLPLNRRELLVIDVGGGSTEFIRGNEAGVSQAVSINIGSVRLTEQFLHSDPVRREEYEKMMVAVERELAPLPHQWLKDSSILTLVGIAGTFTTLSAVEKKLVCYTHGEVHGSRLTLGEVQRQVALFQGQTIAERKAIPGLEPKRADVILAGACLIERIMTLFHAERVLVSDHGVRYGLLHECLKHRNKTVDIFG
ncbi:MAG TPA: Ppx/GppA phosphatase family protein [Candidatus Binatia bacterium]|nr:Ppx/GppA phosphatase family protein [Candidatus Binatia bacterium]